MGRSKASSSQQQQELATLRSQLEKKDTLVVSLEQRSKQAEQLLEQIRDKEHQLHSEKRDQEKKLAMLHHELKEASRKVRINIMSCP